MASWPDQTRHLERIDAQVPFEACCYVAADDLYTA